jgi:hypothetical protein
MCSKVVLNSATIYYVREKLRELLLYATVAGSRVGVASGREQLLIALLDGPSGAYGFDAVCAMLQKGGKWNGTNYPPRATILCGANLEHTTALILGLPSDTSGTVLIRTSNWYPFLDFATSPTTWFKRVGASNPTLSLGEFVTVMLYLQLAVINENNELIVSDKETKISLTMIQNTPLNVDESFIDKQIPAKYQAMDVGQIEQVLWQVVHVDVIDTALWHP